MKRYVSNILTTISLAAMVSCSEISFGDKFLGDQPESSGATTEQMFSSATEAEKVLNRAAHRRAGELAARAASKKLVK